MIRPLFMSRGGVAIVIAGLSLGSVTVAGQTVRSAPTTAASKAAPLRTPDGKPDLQGVWSFATITPLERPAELTSRARRRSGLNDRRLARSSGGGNRPGQARRGQELCSHPDRESHSHAPGYLRLSASGPEWTALR